MGCFSLLRWPSCLGACSRKVRVILGDGTRLQFHGPLQVQELLQGYPNHAIFQGDSRDLEDHYSQEPAACVRLRHPSSKPLLHTDMLQAGNLYLLFPNETESFSIVGPVEVLERSRSQKRGSGSLAALNVRSSAASRRRHLLRAVEIIRDSEGGRVLRLRMLVSKQQVESVVSAMSFKSTSASVVLRGGFFTPLLEEAIPEAFSPTSWRPALDSIPESGSES